MTAVTKTFLILSSSFLIILSSCSIQKQIARQADVVLLKDSSISTGHIGISIYEPATGKYWYENDATKYFVPGSNTKLFTLYAGMKYLGDSLVGLRYHIQNTVKDTVTEIFSSGDPTFLHPDFLQQPSLEFLKKQKHLLINKTYSVNPLGTGWAWDDYKETYMVPRSIFPMYGNVLTVKWISKDSLYFYPNYFSKESKKYGDFEKGLSLTKNVLGNEFVLSPGNNKLQEIPFESDLMTGIGLLADTLKNNNIAYTNGFSIDNQKIYPVIHSQPTDSLFKPMMHRSDNFFAEQTLLMASNEHLGYMSDEAMIDTLLKLDLKDVPQKPKWVDGCGLSRYNLFTPQSFVYILNKMKNEFGMDRLKNILATGGEGTISSYYKKDAGYIFAKTGTLSNICALSGFLYTQKGKLLIFSILANHYQSGATSVRRAVEKFLEGIRNSY